MEDSYSGADFHTHAVLNQPTPLADFDLFTSDRVLVEASALEGAAWAAPGLSAFGRTLGSAETIEAGGLANRNPPTLRSYDRFGRRRDEVEFHPAWHALMGLAVAEGLHTGPWSHPQPGAHVARAAAFYMLGQVEAGVQCPMAMTYGAAPVVSRAPELAAEWLPRLYSRRYDPRFAPPADKHGALMGMGMTEKQGGSDVRANATRAEPVSERAYRLVGHKWFFSAPMCDAFLVLAQAPAGLSCFFLPRWTPDGEPNALRLLRLKDKLGDRANASSEVEFEGAWARLIGEEGRGVPAILEMATYTRLDCTVSSAGLMRQAVAQAIHHAAGRTAFQRRLIDQPLMANVLADLALESEAATRLALRLARAFDRQDDEQEAALRRLLTPAAKYWVCKRASAVTAEALEAVGGNGFVEEGPMPRLYRQTPLNSLWEGAGNLMALDALRALARSPATAEAVAAELEPARGGDARLDRHIAGVLDALAHPPQEAQARRLCESLALAVQGALMVRFSTGAAADGFCASRLDGGSGRAFGTLPNGVDFAGIVERATPSRP